MAPYIQSLADSADTILNIKLSETIEQIRFPNLYRMLKIAEDEKRVNGSNLQTEWKAFREKAAADLDEEMLQQLQSQLFPEQTQPTKISKSLRSLLEELASQHADLFAALKASPSLSAQIAVRTLYAEMISQDLFAEMETLEFLIEDRLSVTPNEKELLRVMSDFELIEATLLFRLVPEAWDRLQAIRATLTPDFLARRMASLGAVISTSQVTSLSEYLGGALRFYDLAGERDEIPDLCLE